MTEIAPALTTWPTLADERLILMTPPSSELANQRTVRALVHRIRELEAERMEWNYSDAAQPAPPLIADTDLLRRSLANARSYGVLLSGPTWCNSTPAATNTALIADLEEAIARPHNKPLTKAQVEEAAEKLFINHSGSQCCLYRTDHPDIMHTSDILFPSDVVHLLCESFSVKE